MSNQPRKDKQRRHDPSSPRTDDAVNLALDLEAAGDAARALRVLAEASKQFPHAIARVVALRAATAQLRAPLPHTDLTDRVLDQWQREELLDTSCAETAPALDANTPLALAGSIPQSLHGTASGAAASHPRRRRPSLSTWTTLFAAGLGLAVAIGLYVSNSTRPAAPTPTAAAPHLLNGEQPVITTVPLSTTPLRLGNASSYDHVTILGTNTYTPRASRPVLSDAPHDSWVFTGLVPPRFTAPRAPTDPHAAALLQSTDH
jgi:hypothetical protein